MYICIEIYIRIHMYINIYIRSQYIQIHTHTGKSNSKSCKTKQNLHYNHTFPIDLAPIPIKSVIYTKKKSYI